jgi:hypothetical protein
MTKDYKLVYQYGGINIVHKSRGTVATVYRDEVSFGYQITLEDQSAIEEIQSNFESYFLELKEKANDKR